jgi:hypothetical protein
MFANGVPSALISLHTAGVASAVCVTSSGTIATSTPESKTICTDRKRRLRQVYGCRAVYFAAAFMGH